MIVLNNKYYGKFILLSNVKKHLLLALILCFFIITGNAQEWVNICPYFEPPTGEYKNLGTFNNLKEGWLIFWGQKKLYHTTDGGSTWSIQLETDSTYFYDIWFVNNINGWAKVYKDIPFRDSNLSPLLRTTDGGTTWHEVSNPPDTAFYAITFIDSLTGYSGDWNAIYNTTDGGESWEEQYVDREIVEPFTDDTVSVQFGLWDIFFVDKQYGWAVGSRGNITDCGVILNTVDGGGTWYIQVPRTQVLYSVYFSDRLHGCAVGPNLWYGGVIMLTENGGETWREYLPGIPWLNDVVFTDNSTGWVVGDYGYIGYTEDGGQSWEQVESGTDADLHRIEFVENGQIGYIFGEDNTLLKYDRGNNSVNDNTARIPDRFELYQNYPNPFNSSTVLKYDLRESGNAVLKVYDFLGREIITLVNMRQSSGRYKIIWSGIDRNGREVSSGIYFYELKVGSYKQIRKMIFIR